MDRPPRRNYSLLSKDDIELTTDPNNDCISMDDPYYNVQPGLCVIINNMDFKQGLRELPHGKRDEESLAVLFVTLGFEVKIHENLTAKEILHKVESYSKLEHKGAFFLVILSHGTLANKNVAAVIGTDGKAVTIHQLKAFFHESKCRSLRGVPKIFLIDACHGRTNEQALNPEPRDWMATKASSGSLTSLPSKEPATNLGDFMTVYASSYGNVAYADSRGSQMTQAFVEATNRAGIDTPFMKIIQKVKAKLQQSDTPQTVESTDTLSRDYFIKRDTPADSIQTLYSKFCRVVEQWIAVREVTIREIQETIEKLKQHHRNVNISRITGSSVSIVGSVMAIAGFALAPFTFGASVGLSVGGIFLAVAGGGTAAGASFTDMVIEKSNVKRAQEQLARDYDDLNLICALAKEIEKQIDDERQQCEDNTVRKAAEGIFQGGAAGLKLAQTTVFNVLKIGTTVLRIGGAAAKGVAAAGVAANVLLIPVDLVEIVLSSHSLANGSQTKAIKRMNEIVVQLAEQKQAIAEILQEQTQETAT